MQTNQLMSEIFTQPPKLELGETSPWATPLLPVWHAAPMAVPKNVCLWQATSCGRQDGNSQGSRVSRSSVYTSAICWPSRGTTGGVLGLAMPRPYKLWAGFPRGQKTVQGSRIKLLGEEFPSHIFLAGRGSHDNWWPVWGTAEVSELLVVRAVHWTSKIQCGSEGFNMEDISSASMMTLLLLLMMSQPEMAAQRWGSLSVFPKPMPVMHNARVLSCLFVTNRSLDLPFLPRDEQISPIEDARHFDLQGSLCFSLLSNTSSGCILLKYQAMGEGGAGWDVSQGRNVSWIQGWWPAKEGSGYPPFQPMWAPFCVEGPQCQGSLPWSGCQSREIIWAKENYFSFSPDISVNSSQAPVNESSPHWYKLDAFNIWLLGGINGNCMDLSPLAMVGGH